METIVVVVAVIRLATRVQILTATGLAKIDANYLNQVRLQQVDIPPGVAFHVCHGASGGLEVGRSGSVHRFLGASMSGRR